MMTMGAGMRVRVTVDETVEPSSKKFEIRVSDVEILQVPSGTKDYTSVNGKPYQFSSIVMLLTICGAAPTVDVKV